MKTKVLVIDDESSIRKFLRVSLEANQYEVAEAATARDGVTAATNFRPEAIILDLGLPDMKGLEVIKLLREWSKTPIIVLTVQDAEDEKISALDAGADDYLTKPFSVPELLARLRVSLRHAQPANQEPIFHSGAFEMDRAGRVVRVEGQVIRLTATEYEILRVLVQNAGKVVTHRMLLKEVWGPNSVEHTQYLRVYLGQIRKKLHVSDKIPELIATEPGVGYRFVQAS